MKILILLCSFAILISCSNSLPVPLTEEPEILPVGDNESDEQVTYEPIDKINTDSEKSSSVETDIKSTSGSPAIETTNSESSDKSLDLENIHLSPKLSQLYQRLAGLDPDLLRTGVIEFRRLLTESKSRDEFLTKLWTGIKPNSDLADDADLKQFKSDLNELATFIQKNHPKVLSWFLSTIGDGRPATTSQKLSFLEKFSEIDEEMSEYPIWNRYWTYWFTSAGDFISKYG